MEDSTGPLRVSRACVSCAEQRKKCSGESPCSNCVRRGCTCVFEAAKRRGPKPGERTARLEAELASLREEVSALKDYFGLPQHVTFTRDGSAAVAANGAVATLVDPLLAVAHAAALEQAKDAAAPSLNRVAQASLANMLTAEVGSKRRRPDSAVAASSASSSAPSSASGAAASAVDPWQPPGSIVPTPAEVSLLRRFFEQANFVMPSVDEEAFWAALEEAKYYTGGEEGDDDITDEEHDDEAGSARFAGSGAASQHIGLKSGLEARVQAAAPTLGSSSSGGASTHTAPPAGTRGSGEAVRTAPTHIEAVRAGVGARTLARHANAYGFRVLFHIVLAGGCMTQPGHQALVRHHYGLARAFLGPCLTAPSQHLVSALLMMVRHLLHKFYLTVWLLVAQTTAQTERFACETLCHLRSVSLRFSAGGRLACAVD